VPLDLVASRIEVCQDAVFPNYRTPKIVVPEGETCSVEQVVLQDDVDFNHHVNNLRYLVLAFEALPPGFRRQNALKSLEVRFLGEAFLGNTLQSVAVRQGTSVWHRLVRKEDQIDVCLMKSSWHPHQCKV
jgi:acyl-ACP thioesterase